MINTLQSKQLIEKHKKEKGKKQSNYNEKRQINLSEMLIIKNQTLFKAKNSNDLHSNEKIS